MGENTSCLFLNSREPRYLLTQLIHDSELARSLIIELQLGSCEQLERISVPMGRILGTPKSETFILGAYPDAVVYYDDDLAVARDAVPVVKKILTRFPNASALVLERNDGNLSFGYAYYERGKLVRALAGCGDRGVTLSYGFPLPAEEEYFNKSIMRDGEMFMLSSHGRIQTMSSVPQCGGQMAYAVALDFLLGRIGGVVTEIEGVSRRQGNQPPPVRAVTLEVFHKKRLRL